MPPLFASLFAHLAWADDALLQAIAAVDAAFDAEMRQALHHIVVVQRFFLSHANGAAYTARLEEGELARQIENPFLKEFRPAVRDALMQAAMHSEHHRGQCAMRLRALGGKPPVLDYIVWVRGGGQSA